MMLRITLELVKCIEEMKKEHLDNPALKWNVMPHMFVSYSIIYRFPKKTKMTSFFRRLQRIPI